MEKKDIIDKAVDTAADEVKKKLDAKLGAEKSDKVVDNIAGSAKELLEKKFGGKK